MSLKPQQTAKYVGVRWTPNAEMASTFIEPLVNKRRYEYMCKAGRMTLRSVGLSDYNGLNTAEAAQFDTLISERWPRRHELHAGIDSVEWTYIQPADTYRFKYHLERPHAAAQRLLIGRDDEATLREERLRRHHLQESVYLDMPTSLLPVESGDSQEYVQRQIMKMRNALADQALAGAYWLTNPQAYIVTYRPEELPELAQLYRERGQTTNN